MIEADLEELLRGVVAVSAFREKRSLPYGRGVFDLALVETLKTLEKQLARERVELTFRLRRDALSAKSSQLANVVARIAKDGWLEVAEDQLLIRLVPTTAYAYLAVQTLPINVLERAAKSLWRRLHVAKLRRRFPPRGKD